MSFRRVVSLLLLAVYLPACTAYHQTETPLVQLTAPPKPVERVRVTTAEGARLQVWSPRVAGDSLVGFTKSDGRDSSWVAVPLSTIRSTEVQKVDAVRTLGGVAIVGASFFVLFAAIFLLSYNS